MKIRAIIIEGPADEAALAAIREAMQAPLLTCVFARPSVQDVIDRVSHEMGVTKAEILGEGRSKRAVRARKAIAWLAYRVTGKGSAAIARAMGGHEHNLPPWQERAAEGLRASDPAFEALTSRLHEFYTGERP